MTHWKRMEKVFPSKDGCFAYLGMLSFNPGGRPLHFCARSTIYSVKSMTLATVTGCQSCYCHMSFERKSWDIPIFYAKYEQNKYNKTSLRNRTLEMILPNFLAEEGHVSGDWVDEFEWEIIRFLGAPNECGSHSEKAPEVHWHLRILISWCFLPAPPKPTSFVHQTPPFPLTFWVSRFPQRWVIEDQGVRHICGCLGWVSLWK